jgi:hypothetical protein
MSDNLKPGVILIEDRATVPALFQFDDAQSLRGWKSVKESSTYTVDQQLCEAGWHYFFMAGEINATVFGSDAEKATRKAIQRVLETQNSEKFNCLQIDRVAVKHFLGMPYVRVSTHWRHIQESMFLSRADRLAAWNLAAVIQGRN